MSKIKRQGQNFLIDPAVAERMAGYAMLGQGDCVLEIGPGTGNLTSVLASRAESVWAVEVDPVLARLLDGRFSNVRVVNADALRVELPDCRKIVSNLPYQISSKITYRILSRPFELAVLMFQREFALRMTAPPGNERYGRLAMVTDFFCRAEILEIVPRSAFRPVPAVSSAIVRLLPKTDRPAGVDVEDFMRLSEGLFKSRRKKVKTSLALLGISREKLASMNADLLEMRPEELSSGDVTRLCLALRGQGPRSSEM